MINAKMTKSFNYKNIKFNFSDDLNKSINIVARDIENGILRGAQFNQRFKPNAESTLKQKQGNKPLIDKGIMHKAKDMQKEKATKQKQVATLLPVNGRVDIAFWNDQGTKNIPARPFWGISKRSEEDIIDRMEKRVRKIIKKAGGRA